MSPQGRFEEGAAAVSGRRFERVHARGKHLFYEFAPRKKKEPADAPRLVHIHLGRYGKVTPLPPDVPAPVGQVRVRMLLAKGRPTTLPEVPGVPDPGPVAGFDLRGPTKCETVPPAAMEAVFARLGPDPLAPKPGDVKAVRAAFAKSPKPAGALIMDQAVVSGVGNIFRAEAFYELRMDPTRPARDLTDEEFAALWRVTKRQMKTGLDYGKIVTRTAREAGRPRADLNKLDRFRIYRQPRCPACGAEPLVWDLGGRTMYACGPCQGVAL